MQQKEKNLLILALSGPVVFLLVVVTIMIFHLRGGPLVVAGVASMAGSILAFIGLYKCILWIVNKENRGRPKLPWVLLGLLDFAIVLPYLFLLFGGRW